LVSLSRCAAGASPDDLRGTGQEHIERALHAAIAWLALTIPLGALFRKGTEWSHRRDLHALARPDGHV